LAETRILSVVIVILSNLLVNIDWYKDSDWISNVCRPLLQVSNDEKWRRSETGESPQMLLLWMSAQR